MKFNTKMFFYFVIFAFSYLLDSSYANIETNKMKVDADVYLEVQGLIKKFAEEKSKTSNIEVKRRLIGILPEGYPQETVERALKIRKDRRRWNKVMMIPTELYRVCLYPTARVNYEKWCNNVYVGAKTKITSKQTIFLI
jgi:hypothetical protein